MSPRRPSTLGELRKYPCASCGTRTQLHAAPCPHAPSFKKDPAATLVGAGPGRKDDTGKQRWDLLPFGVIALVVQVMTFGANKYEANNWQNVLCSDGRYFAALMRHL